MNIKNKYNEFIKLNRKYDDVASSFEDILDDINLKEYHWSIVLTELVDSLIDIYNVDLLNWANNSKNVEYIEDAVNEYGLKDDFDFYHLIRLGQFYYYDKKIDDLYDEFITYLDEQLNDEEWAKL